MGLGAEAARGPVSDHAKVERFHFETREELVERIGVTYVRPKAIVNGRRGVSTNTALRLEGLTLVTNDTREFGRVKGL